MKFQITVSNQYGTSYMYEGYKKAMLTKLRDIAASKRRASRQLHGLTDDVFSINSKLHQSRLVTMASFDLNQLGSEQIVKLLNDHGVEKFSFSKKHRE